MRVWLGVLLVIAPVCAIGRSSMALGQGIPAGPVPVPVFVEHIGDDEVGRALAYRIREELRLSRGYPLAATRADALALLHIVSVDSPCGNGGAKSAVSLIWLVNNEPQSFLRARIVDLGISRVGDEAKDAVAKIDYEISQWRSRR